jgi:hypothetical protein
MTGPTSALRSFHRAPPKQGFFALISFPLLVLMGASLGQSVVWAAGKDRAVSSDTNVIRAETHLVHATSWALRIPKDSVNLALKTSGATATASSTAEGFSPDGVLDGVWTAENWGKGHGWQSAKKHEFPCWLEVHLPHEEEIDTIVIQTFPPVMRGLNWLGLRNVDLLIKFGGEWVPLGYPASIRANLAGTMVQPLLPLKISAIRIVVVGVNTGHEEDVFYDDDELARILQVGLYRLKMPTPFVPEEVSVPVESGPLGRIAIYKDDLPIQSPHPSSPEFLASVFRKAGYGVTFLNTSLLSIPQIFNRQNFDVFVHPYGAPFPTGTVLFDFLKAGGHLITLGGHPFRRALMYTPDGKLVDAHYDPGITVTVTRPFNYELPYQEQLGMFYNSYRRLENIAHVKIAPSQSVVTTPLRLDASLEGEVASAFVGERMSLDDGRRLAEQGIYPGYAHAAREGLANIVSVVNGYPNGVPFDSLDGYVFNWPRSRWIPLVNAYDRLGKLKGSILSLLLNYEKPYAGSGWIYSGVESEDLFSAQHPEFTRALLEALRFVRRSWGLHNVESDMDCYRQGEAAKIFAVVDNFRDAPRSASLKFEFFAKGSESAAFAKTLPLMLKPGERQRPAAVWQPPHFDSGLYTVRISLSENGKEIDRLETGFVVWDPKVLAQGPKIELRDLYFQSAGHPQFLVGARSEGIYPHGEVAEDVMAWDQQFAVMHDQGMRVFSPVFFSEYIPGFVWGKEGSPLIPPQLQRLMDAQVQLAQKHGLIYAPCIFFMTRHMAMAQPELSAKICEELGRRYASVPGIMFYIFDDGAYTTPFEEFRNWSKVCVEAFAKAGRQYIVMAEMDRSATWLQRYATSALTFPTGGLYPPDIGDPALERLVDMRMAGRSFHTSEFGVYASGARPGDYDPNSELGVKYTSGSLAGDYSFYLLEPHMAFALGGPYILNWMWNDPPQTIFPWGIVEANDFVPKKTLIAFRNQSYFLRHFQPAFHPPQVLVVFAKEHLMRDGRVFTQYLKSVMRQLVDESVQFAVIDDFDLDHLAGPGHFLIYPDPRFATREVLEKLQARVEAGDDLFLSGDFTQPLEENGARETTWFERLAGLTWLADRAPAAESGITPTSGGVPLVPYLGTPLARFKLHGAEALASDGDGRPALTAFTIGKGKVVYTSDTSAEGVRRALALFLDLASAPRTPVSPVRPNRPVFELDRADGGRVYTLFATKPDRSVTAPNGPWIESPESYTLRKDERQMQVPLGAYGVSLVAVQKDNSIDAVEGQGEFKENGSLLMASEPHVMAMSLDQHPLRESEAVALFPIGTGAVTLMTQGGMDTVEAGEVVDGQFRVLEKIPTKQVEGGLTFRIDEVQSQCILLVASAGRLGQAHQLMNAAVQ